MNVARAPYQINVLLLLEAELINQSAKSTNSCSFAYQKRIATNLSSIFLCLLYELYGILAILD